jgi:signal transduction histidine kinase
MKSPFRARPSVPNRELRAQLPTFMLALDQQDRIAHWDENLEKTTGFTQEEMRGTPGATLVAGGGDRKLPIKGGGHRIVRWERHDLPASAAPAVTYAFGVDVTHEREMLRRVLRAERLAAVGTLATGLAHQMRNPLNAANLQLEVLRRRLAGDGQRGKELGAVVQIVSAEIQRLDRLASDFLSFAQPPPLELVLTDLNALVAAVADRIRPETTRAGIELCCELDPAVGSLEVEPESLEQAISHLVQNALEAMTAGRGRLSLRTRAADDHGNVRIEIEDTGPGFAEEAPIFDAFYTTKDGGTGLGLAIVHRIIGDHGGSIQAESRRGCTRLTASLPQLRV